MVLHLGDYRERRRRSDETKDSEIEENGKFHNALPLTLGALYPGV
jgi:hypothetical protein